MAFFYPWPQRPAGLIETAFDELASRWQPILDHAEDNDVNICYEIHLEEDLHDGVTFEMFLERVDNHAAICFTIHRTTPCSVLNTSTTSISTKTE